MRSRGLIVALVTVILVSQLVIADPEPLVNVEIKVRHLDLILALVSLNLLLTTGLLAVSLFDVFIDWKNSPWLQWREKRRRKDE